MSDFEEKRNIGEKVINNSERIEALEKNCEVSFAKVENHIERILKVIDVQAQSITALRNLIQSNAISDLNHYTVNKNRIAELRDNYDRIPQMIIKLNELKEHLDIHVNIFSRHDERFQILYKVLRDDYKFKIEKLPDNELKKHYEGLLEKLEEVKK